MAGASAPEQVHLPNRRRETNVSGDYRDRNPWERILQMTNGTKLSGRKRISRSTAGAPSPERTQDGPENLFGRKNVPSVSTGWNRVSIQEYTAL